jgi:DNA-binding transcriptional ArsR family regulator
MTSVEYVEERDLTGRPLHVAAAPLASVLMAVRDAAGAERSDTPEAWRRVIRAHLTHRDYEVLAPLATSEPTLVPSSLVPFPGPSGQTFKDALEQIVAAEDALVREIDECMVAGSAGDWREPARHPRRWVRGLVLALARAWSGFRPIWLAGQEGVAAELDRVTAACARGAHLHVLGELIPYAHVCDDRWVLECACAQDVRLAVPEGGLTLVPLVAGRRASILDGDATIVRGVAYPLRPRAVPADSGLEALLGIPRARILRELDEPSSNNRLADVLATVPSAATHHVSALVSAGLVVRERSEGILRVRRTPRGDALLTLYEAG